MAKYPGLTQQMSDHYSCQKTVWRKKGKSYQRFIGSAILATARDIFICGKKS